MPFPRTPRRSAWFVVALAAVLAAAKPAAADVGVDSVSPHAAGPGDTVTLRIYCGGCTPGMSFPISLVPAAERPRPEPCGSHALCTPASSGAPTDPPFISLGRSDPASRHASRGCCLSGLRFEVPEVEPGRYAFVIYCAACHAGPKGSMIGSDRPSDALRVTRGDQVSSGGHWLAALAALHTWLLRLHEAL
jgi:hypothetical protein